MLNTTVRFMELPGGYGYYAADYAYDWNYILSRKYYEFARRLDGRTDPYKALPSLAPGEVREMLLELDRQDLLRYERTSFKTIFSRYFTLCAIRQPGPVSLALARVVNLMLALLWLPSLLYVLFHLRAGLSFVFFDPTPFCLAVLPLILLSEPIHELGHVCAGFSSGAQVFEAGFFLALMPGFYVYMSEDEVHDPLSRIQNNAAGLEMTCFLSALFFLLAARLGHESLWMTAGTYVAVELIYNLLPFPGTDGRKILCELIELRRDVT